MDKSTRRSTYEPGLASLEIRHGIRGENGSGRIDERFTILSALLENEGEIIRRAYGRLEEHQYSRIHDKNGEDYNSKCKKINKNIQIKMNKEVFKYGKKEKDRDI